MPAYIKTMASSFSLHIHQIRCGEQITMQRVLASVCVLFLSFLGSLGQETTQTQTSTDAVSTTIDWDTTSPPVATSVADTQAENAISPRSNADYTMMFANPWGPMLMPMKTPPYGDSVYNRKTRYEVKDIVDVYPFLRRPDGYYPTEWNDTVAPGNGRYPMPTGYQPYPPPGIFYPQPMPNSDYTRYPDQSDSFSQVTKSQAASEIQTDSADSPPPAFYRPPFSSPYASRDNQQFFSYPALNYFWRNRGDGRGQDNTVPATPYPYPAGFYPPGGPPMYPEVNVYVRPPPYGDESVAPEYPAERRQSLPTTGPISSTIPAGTPVPFQPNMPSNPIPFGYPPPAFLFPRPSPILPNRPPPPNNNILDGPLPQLPSPPPNPVESPIANLPPPPPSGTVPDVVNVDVFDSDTTKPGDGPSDNIPYKFGYDMNDGLGTDQHREESADEAGVVTGSYGYRDLHGVYRMVNYIADKDGFRASVKTNEPGAANPGSADVVVMAERPPLETVAEGLRRSDVGVDVIDDQSEMEIESVEKK